MLSKLTPRSILFTIASAVFGRMSSAISQIIAGIYLTPTDFGVYAAANAIVTACTVLRAGGTGNHVQTMTPAEFESEAGPLFRYSMIFTALGASLSVAATLLIPNLIAGTSDYPAATLAKTATVLVAGVVAFNITVFPRAWLVAKFRIEELAALDTTLGMIRVFAFWLLARNGMGAVALAATPLLAWILESAWTWPRSGIRLRHLRVERGWLRQTFLEMRLPLVIALLISLNSQTDSVVASAFLPVSVLGAYYFASQIAMQPTTLVGSTLRSVFTAATAQMRHEPKLGQAAVRDVFNGAMVFMPLVCMALPAVFDSFEVAVWNGKWNDSRYPVLILSATLIYPSALQLISAPITGLRDWKLAIRIDALRAAARIVPAFIACLLLMKTGWSSSSIGLALSCAVGGTSALVSSLEIYRILSRAGMPPASILYELYSTPLAALMSAFAASGLARSIVEPLHATLGIRGTAGVECAMATTIYIALALILLRFGYTTTLQRLVDELPEFLRPYARRLFVL